LFSNFFFGFFFFLNQNPLGAFFFLSFLGLKHFLSSWTSGAVGLWLVLVCCHSSHSRQVSNARNDSPFVGKPRSRAGDKPTKNPLIPLCVYNFVATSLIVGGFEDEEGEKDCMCDLMTSKGKIVTQKTIPAKPPAVITIDFDFSFVGEVKKEIGERILQNTSYDVK